MSSETNIPLSWFRNNKNRQLSSGMFRQVMNGNQLIRCHVTSVHQKMTNKGHYGPKVNKVKSVSLSGESLKRSNKLMPTISVVWVFNSVGHVQRLNTESWRRITLHGGFFEYCTVIKAHFIKYNLVYFKEIMICNTILCPISVIHT